MSEMTDIEKPDYYKLAEEFPDKYRILESGAVYGKAEGKIVAMDASRNPYAITEENSLDYHRQRANLVIQSQSYARSGVAAHLDTPTALDAWADIVGAQAEQATAKGNRSTEAARFVGQATGFMVDSRQSGGNNELPGGAPAFAANAEGLKIIMEALMEVKKRRESDVIEG